MPFGLYTAASRFGLPDLGISERLSGFSTKSAMNFPVGAGLSPSQSNAARGQVAGIMQSLPQNQSTQPRSLFYNSSGGGNLFQTALQSVRAPRVSNAPQSYQSAAKPTVGTTKQTSKSKAVSNAPVVDPNAEYNQQLNELFGGTENFLSGLYGSIDDAQSGALGAIGSQFDAQRPFLDQSRDELMGQNRAQVDAEKMNEKNAIAEARLLYNELGQGTRQRYGGTSSTGEFANAIQGREFQRGQNRISTTSQQNQAALQQKAQSIESNYQQEVIRLETTKQSALQQAKASYDEKRAQIDSLRHENQQAKAAAKLDALREFRAAAEGIENQKRQFEQQLEAQALSAAQNIYAAIQSYRAEQGQPVDLQGIPGAQFSSILGNQATADTTLPQGFMKKPDTSDPYMAQGLFQPEEYYAGA